MSKILLLRISSKSAFLTYFLNLASLPVLRMPTSIYMFMANESEDVVVLGLWLMTALMVLLKLDGYQLFDSMI